MITNASTQKTIPFQFFITMKKNLFRKFLALFLTGTMLAGVGCKDYDDDIDDLKGCLLYTSDAADD